MFIGKSPLEFSPEDLIIIVKALCGGKVQKKYRFEYDYEFNN